MLDEIECPSQLITKESKGTFGTAPAPRDLTNYVIEGYNYSASNTGATQYAVINQGTPYHPATNFWRYPGHTTGTATDAYLAVNGSLTVGDFYKDTLQLYGGITYTISFWHQAASDANDYELAAQILDSVGVTLASAGSGPQRTLGWKLASVSYTSPINQKVVFRLRNLSTNAAGNDFSIDDISFVPSGCPDIDNDGIPNSLDLDSDGDGCSDAVESGTVTSLTAITVAGPYGANGFANSLETSSESGVYTGTYTYNEAINSRITNCADTDSDGIKDNIDLDDDNDGVLDCTENYSGVLNLSAAATTITNSNIETTGYIKFSGSRYNISNASAAPIGFNNGDLGISLIAGNEIQTGYQFNFTKPVSQIPSVDEMAQDAVNDALVAGTGITKTYNDGANTITVAVDTSVIATKAELAEVAQDSINDALTAGSGITKSYNDAANTLTVSVDTSTIAEKSWVTSNFDGVGSAANAAANAAAALSNHASDTTDVHGIADTALLATKAYAEGYTDSQINLVLGTAPAALNTLQELAAAINNDASYASTVTSSLTSINTSISNINNDLALKAPLASPTFTGNVGLPSLTLS